MWTIVRWTLWQRRWGLFWWSFGIVATAILVLGLYPSIRDQAAQLNRSFGDLSNGTLALFGGTDFFSPTGYLNSQLIYFTLPLLLAILAIGLGTNLIGHEESTGTLESLLSRPVSRSKLLVAKALAGALGVAIVTFLGSVATILMAKFVNLGIPLDAIALACLACYLLALTFGAVAFLLAATGRGRIAALGIATVYAIGGYLIGSLSSTVHWLHKPSLVFPYHYFRTADILQGAFHIGDMLFCALFTLICCTLAWLVFRRRDLI